MTAPAPGLLDRLVAGLPPDVPDTLGVAVSGGGDSLALLTLLNDWRASGGPALRAVSVDHGLRPGAAVEVRAVARLCTAWGVPHASLRWHGWDGTGNLHDRARRARYALIAGWAREAGIGTIALGHTLDDQAETFLMRLAREAGVDGLAAMAPRWAQDGVAFVRPMLGIRRQELRALLRARGIDWAEDPSNDDPAFERTRARAALAALGPLGLEAPALARVAGHLGEARDALRAQMAEAAARSARIEAGDVVIDRAGLAALAPETARRLVQEALWWIGGSDYPARGAALARALDRIGAGHGHTLQGCRLIVRSDTVRITREARAVAGHAVAPGAVWDGRWRLSGPEAPGATIAALGEAGLRLCPDRRANPLPAASLRTTPAVWHGDKLIAAPVAGAANGWRFELLGRPGRNFPALLAH